MMKKINYQLYLVTDDQLPEAQLFAIVEQSVQGGIKIIQLRDKRSKTQDFIHKAQILKTQLQFTNIPLIINDRVDIALAVNADGVHLGQTDMPVDIARQLLGPDKIIGLSVESHQQLLEANALDIDYIGLSAIYQTDTKKNTKFEWKLEGLKWALQHSCHPVIAIGGINETTLPLIAQTGVHGIAMVSAICQTEHPKETVQTLLKCIRRYHHQSQLTEKT